MDQITYGFTPQLFIVAAIFFSITIALGVWTYSPRFNANDGNDVQTVKRTGQVFAFITTAALSVGIILGSIAFAIHW